MPFNILVNCLNPHVDGEPVQFVSNCQDTESNKLHLDKYYTPDWVARKCIAIANEVIGADNITEYFEPSAGKGVFVNELRGFGKPIEAVDIEPEADGIEKQDFLRMQLPYRKGRLFIGNPPFGARNVLLIKFCKKCFRCGDYVAFIEPISQLNNNASIFEFDLVKSVDLGLVPFSGSRSVPCCFNVYVRPVRGENRKVVDKMQNVFFKRSDSEGYDEFPYDFRLICWGGRTGQLLTEGEADHAATYKIRCADVVDKELVRSALLSARWEALKPNTSMRKIQLSSIVKVLKEAGID